MSKAIRDGEFHVLPELMMKASTETGPDSSMENKQATYNPLWMVNSRGWAPMHVAAASSSQMSYRWWKWILQKQQENRHLHCANSSIQNGKYQPEQKYGSTLLLWTAKTDMGQTCTDLFFRTSLCPLPWQRHALKENAKLIRQAIQSICDCPQKLQQLREQIEVYCNQEEIFACRRYEEESDQVALYRFWQEKSDTDVSERPILPFIEEELIHPPEMEEERDPVTIVLEFWKKMHLLLYSAYYGTNLIVDRINAHSDSHSIQNKQYQQYFLPIVHLLSSLPWCPEIVARLAVSLYPWHCREQREGLLPLHRWAQTSTMSNLHQHQQHTRYKDAERNGKTAWKRHDSGILSWLCQVYPDAASIPDPTNHGRLPLHAALALGKPWDVNTQIIFDAFPDAVQQIDPFTNLPCFCLAAMKGATTTRSKKDDDDEIENTAKQLDQQRLSLCWSYLSKHEKARALERARIILDCQQLTTIFEVLRKCPSALQVTMY
eukprot:CAMPEP_0178872410 /NCGR_PEP_ID=MMETSP0747-20121128/8116_1 /TAXON_ID=913974 /ORGANISM="Nitzschia punctata, Strain CCMP561" /LENGTH=489 /DNA_ID=CAMNT_0020539637 /DNA_START=79 /DNA_END=1548 /DNA_ORIENTATION=+